MKLAELHAERSANALEENDPAQDTPASPYYTPSGRYFASQADAAFWTKIETECAERNAERRIAATRRMLAHAARRTGAVIAARLDVTRERAERHAHADVVAAGLVF